MVGRADCSAVANEAVRNGPIGAQVQAMRVVLAGCTRFECDPRAAAEASGGNCGQGTLSAAVFEDAEPLAEANVPA